MMHDARHTHHTESTHGEARVKQRDPVCGMTVPPDGAVREVHDGTTYVFCSEHCLRKFRDNPARYVSGAPLRGGVESAPDLAQGTAYICPMHPEIVRTAPGSCPICGMALEPRTATLEEPENPELVDMRRRFWVSAALTLPVFAIAMSEMLPGGGPRAGWLPQGALTWIQLALATPVVLWGGAPFFVRGWQSVVTRHLNMFTLIGLGVAVAYAYSVVAAV
ncbi:MAG: YHS domain-containing protein, partial [Gemmatimonadota bacterium]|nr:YHS domain-containing protein [Gemmatimonadota bacterium]